MTTSQQPQNNSANQPEFVIQRVYVKDSSFESPNAPDIFQQEWKPELNLQLQTNTKQIAPDMHEVALKINVTVKSDNKTAFIAEVEQAGIFTLRGFPEDQLRIMLGSICPSILFPYGREMVTDLVNRGTFPPLYLAPINFEALYQQQLEQQKQGEGTATH